MGTRGAYGFRIDEQDKLSYNHMDSYPTGLGLNVMEYIKKTPVFKMKKIARRIILVDGDSKPTEKQIEECKKWAETEMSGMQIGSGRLDDWYNLLHKAQGDLYVYYDLKYMINSESFLLNSLFCEWAYIINLDSEMLEIYQGFNQIPDVEGRYGRYANLKGDSPYAGGEQYYGVRLLIKFNLDYIQSLSLKNIELICEKLESLVDNEEIPIKDAKTAYEVLGVDKDASKDEIEKAYKKKVQLYHPDKVASLAPEFMEIAEECMKKINAAREELKRDAEKRP